MAEKKEVSRCVMCGKEKPGIEVKTDGVIKAMRWFGKTALHRDRHHRLVVCKECYIDYTKARKKYTNRQTAYLIIGILFTALLLISSGFNPVALVPGIILIAFLYLLSLVSYVPELSLSAKQNPAKPEKR